MLNPRGLLLKREPRPWAENDHKEWRIGNEVSDKASRVQVRFSSHFPFSCSPCSFPTPPFPVLVASKPRRAILDDRSYGLLTIDDGGKAKNDRRYTFAFLSHNPFQALIDCASVIFGIIRHHDVITFIGPSRKWPRTLSTGLNASSLLARLPRKMQIIICNYQRLT